LHAKNLTEAINTFGYMIEKNHWMCGKICYGSIMRTELILTSSNTLVAKESALPPKEKKETCGLGVMGRYNCLLASPVSRITPPTTMFSTLQEKKQCLAHYRNALSDEERSHPSLALHTSTSFVVIHHISTRWLHRFTYH
jgi:hypothetical protein